MFISFSFFLVLVERVCESSFLRPGRGFPKTPPKQLRSVYVRLGRLTRENTYKVKQKVIRKILKWTELRFGRKNTKLLLTFWGKGCLETFSFAYCNLRFLEGRHFPRQNTRKMNRVQKNVFCEYVQKIGF